MPEVHMHASKDETSCPILGTNIHQEVSTLFRGTAQACTYFLRTGVSQPGLPGTCKPALPAQLSVRSKPFAVHMFVEGLTWQLFTPFALRRLRSRHQKYKSRHLKIIKHDNKSLNIDQIHKIGVHAPKIQRRLFLRKPKCHRELRRKGLGILKPIMIVAFRRVI